MIFSSHLSLKLEIRSRNIWEKCTHITI